ncbi:unnamed protein product [Caenorhabditis angaria]|uniref:Multifunctional methyltransferase subunit TRM112-like protein n=1 Tax=Caenorhabditis angaria TaxID=860376 RepID=A0A9P1IE01_9PELO|nr:unnamed protein product [Caenorhabditis angaria]
MKLLTHNFVSSRFLKDVKGGYPLKLSAQKIETKDVEFNEEFIKNIIPKCDFSALRSACESINEAANLPQTLPENWIENEELLKELHRLLFCIDIIEGELQCPDTARIFPIKQGIPNLLVEDEQK